MLSRLPYRFDVSRMFFVLWLGRKNGKSQQQNRNSVKFFVKQRITARVHIAARKEKKSSKIPQKLIKSVITKKNTAVKALPLSLKANTHTDARISGWNTLILPDWCMGHRTHRISHKTASPNARVSVRHRKVEKGKTKQKRKVKKRKKLN